MSEMPCCRLVEDATRTLVHWARTAQEEAASPFEAARRIVTRLGARRWGDRARLGFWAPVLARQEIPHADVVLELFTPLDPLDLTAKRQTCRFHRQRLPVMRDGDYVWAVVAGMRAGTREQVGTFYRLRYRDAEGVWRTIPDMLACSVPFGAFAPAEFYDIEAMHAGRADAHHFARLETEPDPDGVPRIVGPTNLLQIHVGTASEEGTLAGLTRIYETIAEKRRNGKPLTPAEQNYVGYDGVQLMPIEPTIEYEAGPNFWEEVEADEESVTIEVRRPDMTNWGYDIITVASPAVNPVILGSGRPDEFVDFLAALHTFPDGPIMVVLDIVYGHADNQSLSLLPEEFYAGPGMYGQEIDFRHPVVRALLLEMQRRKSDFGVDGVRVDGAQDFKYWDPEARELKHDDEYLTLMNAVVQEVAGVRYRPWMIFEDGRPWPRDDWELASTYREVTKRHPNVVQWGPLTFAHNTPFLFTFWVSKWWRIQEIAEVGSHWITGCANHDTLRRGTQVDPEARINTYLGDTLPQIFRKAYDNPAAKLFDYAMMPGVPMDFINAAMRAPWAFIRNTDDRYAVKVVSEEAHFLDWVMHDALYAQPHVFPRLKALGFERLDELRRFMRTLAHAVDVTGYAMPAMIELLRHVEPPLDGPPPSIKTLKQIARAWMDDVYEICNVSHYMPTVDAEQAAFNLAVREFRRARPWLRENLRPDETFDRLRPTDGSVIFFGLRRAPGCSEELLFVANMEGAPRTLTPVQLPIPHLLRDSWEVALQTPGLDVATVEEPVTLRDSEAVVFTRHV
ncbi:MAG: glucosylglycerol hydrolase [Anaerolineae bacterium]